MATTRTSRRGGSTGSQAPTPTVSAPKPRSPSPLSPTRISRANEKRQMQLLNNRLASYIEAVQARDIEIGNLKQERSSVEETFTTEVTHVKTMYNRELEQLRAALDSVSKEKAKLAIDADKNSRDAREAKSDFAAMKKRLSVAEKDLAVKTQRLAETDARLAALEDELRRLGPENSKLAAQLSDAKRNLEDETLRSTDLQNQLITTQEGLKFENSVLEQQLNETRVRKQMEISEIDGRLSDEYERKLQKSLDDLRETYEGQMAANREEFGQLHEDKVVKLQSKLDGERSERAGLSTHVTSLTSQNLELESRNGVLQKRASDLSRDLENLEARFRAELAKRDADIRGKDEQIQDMLKDHNDLMEVKIALDMEIAAYRKMLDLEEARLGLSPDSSPSSSGGEGRGIKRRRTFVEDETIVEMVSDHSGLGNAFVETVDKGAKSVRVTNKTDGDLSLGGWTLSNASGDSECSYKFPRSTTLRPGATCSVWSSDVAGDGSGVEHSPPETLIMKKGGWVIGSENRTTLMGRDGSEEACRISREERRHVGTYRLGRGSLRSGSADPDKSCAVM